MTEASKFAIDRPALSVGSCMTIKDADFKSALAKVSPSLSATVLLLFCYRVFPFYWVVYSPHGLDFVCVQEVKNWEVQSKKIDVHSSSVMDW